MAKDLICPDRLMSVIGASDKYLFSKADLFKIISEQQRLPSVPAGADTAVVIRCKDCKFYETEGNYCERDIVKSLLATEPTDYCSWAERREDNA